jgi:hypothetical protein
MKIIDDEEPAVADGTDQRHWRQWMPSNAGCARDGSNSFTKEVLVDLKLINAEKTIGKYSMLI